MSAARVRAPTLVMPMIVESELLGQISVEEDEVITFPSGLLGFPACRNFVLISSAREGMYWLQSTEHSPLAFLLVDPFIACEEFVVDVGPGDLADVGANEASQIAILAIVTLSSAEQGGCTVNLQGPLAFNLEKKQAKQIAVANSDFGVRYPIDLKAAV
jgi:flagellar assembly factor FliW